MTDTSKPPHRFSPVRSGLNLVSQGAPTTTSTKVTRPPYLALPVPVGEQETKAKSEGVPNCFFCPSSPPSASRGLLRPFDATRTPRDQQAPRIYPSPTPPFLHLLHRYPTSVILQGSDAGPPYFLVAEDGTDLSKTFGGPTVTRLAAKQSLKSAQFSPTLPQFFLS